MSAVSLTTIMEAIILNIKSEIKLTLHLDYHWLLPQLLEVHTLQLHIGPSLTSVNKK
jgi:hypothetical protein